MELELDIPRCKRCGIGLFPILRLGLRIKLCPDCFEEYIVDYHERKGWKAYPQDNLCVKCGKYQEKLTPHHIDYINLSNIEWLCHDCHHNSIALEYDEICNNPLKEIYVFYPYESMYKNENFKISIIELIFYCMFSPYIHPDDFYALKEIREKGGI